MKICPSCDGKCADSIKYCPRCNRYLGGVSSISEKEYYKNTQIQNQQISKPIPKCPTCSSTNISKIGTVNRMVSVGLFGLSSSKIGKTHKCNNCGTTW